MDKDQVKGVVNDEAGRVKRVVGKWSGDTNLQAEGTAQQIKGKAQKAWGTVKDAARTIEANNKREREAESDRRAESQRAHSQHGR